MCSQIVVYEKKSINYGIHNPSNFASIYYANKWVWQ